MYVKIIIEQILVVGFIWSQQNLIISLGIKQYCLGLFINGLENQVVYLRKGGYDIGSQKY